MKPLLLFVLLAAALSAAPVRPALETTLRGANGTEVPFRIVGVWADGFHFQPSPTRPATFVAWDKVDEEWLASERPEIARLRAGANPFPVLSAEEAQAKLDAARKQFRAPREIAYTWAGGPNGVPVTRTAPNVIAAEYAAKLRRLTPVAITEGLRAIIVDRERDLQRLQNARGADAAQKLWLEVNFVRVLAALEAAQREIDPLNAGTIALPADKKLFPSTDPEVDWF